MMRLRIFWFLTLFCVVSVMVMIFCFSEEDADRSSEKSGAVMTYIVETAEQVVPALQENSHFNRDLLETVIRKCAHFTEFALLAFFLNLHILADQLLYIEKYLSGKAEVCGSSGRLISNTRTESRKAFDSEIPAISVAISSIYAVTDEIHQSMVPGRAGRFYDVGIDTLGACFGTLLFLTLPRQKVTMWLTVR